MRKVRVNKQLNKFRKMPELYHRFPNEKYDPTKSEVLKWIKEQPELIEWIFNLVEKRDLVKYDKETGKWHGVKEGDENDA